MKNKKFIYALIFSVAAVWGIIFYRIFMAAAPEEIPQVNREMSFSKISLEKYEAKDTFNLALNYKDPFMERAEQQEIEKVNVVDKKITVIPVPQPVLNRDYVKYSSYIINPSTKNNVAIITVNGKEQMMSEGDVSGDIQLLKNYKDSVSILYKGKTYFVRKTN